MDEDAVHVLFLAHSDGTIGDEELVCFLTTLAEDEAAASKDDDLRPRFDLDVVTDKTCNEPYLLVRRRGSLHPSQKACVPMSFVRSAKGVWSRRT